jgi:hypothetical protein
LAKRRKVSGSDEQEVGEASSGNFIGEPSLARRRFPDDENESPLLKCVPNELIDVAAHVRRGSAEGTVECWCRVDTNAEGIFNLSDFLRMSD